MKKVTIILITIFAILLVIIGVFVTLRVIVLQEESSCAEAGETSSNPSLGPSDPQKECCPGLVEISNARVYSPNSPDADEDGCTFALGGGSICSECGNGKCEGWENPCSCPTDCN